MQQKVELDRLLTLEQGLKRLNRTLEEQVTGMYKAVSGQVRSAQSAYPESCVRSPAQEVERLLRETKELAASISSRLDKKEAALRWAAGQYRSTEQKARSLMKVSSSFTWKQAGTLFSRWLQTARDQAAGGLQDLLRNTPTLIEMIKDLLLNVRDASLDKRLQPFMEDKVITSLLQQRDHGSPEEQQLAREQLARIAEALDEIGRSQMAYGVYEKYGNLEYMKSANLHAEEQRKLLQELGVDPGLYTNVDLRSQYRGSPLSACTYNPLQNDGSAVPSSDELRFAIALGLVNDKYREWATANYKDIEKAVKQAELQRELERQLAEYKRLNDPPTTLPDGTPITAKNKENETTLAYFLDKVYDPNDQTKVMYTAYYVWLEETYGMTEWRKKVVQADRVTTAFVGGLIESTVMGVVDTVQFTFNFVIDPEKTSQEVIDKAAYIIDNPDVLVQAAKKMYKNFDEGTPEEKAKMLGSVASLLVPGVSITKSGVVGKVADKVMDPLTDAMKKVPDALKNSNVSGFPNWNPLQNQLIPDTAGVPGPFKPPGQVWRFEGNGNGHNLDTKVNEITKEIKKLDEQIAKLKKEGNEDELKRLEREKSKLANKLDTPDDISEKFDLIDAEARERKIDNSKYFEHDKGDFGEEVAKNVAESNNLGEDISEMFQVGRNGIDATYLSKGPPPKLTMIESKASQWGRFSYSDAQKSGGKAYFEDMLNSDDPRYADFGRKFDKLEKEYPGLEFNYIRVETDIKITEIGFGVDELKIKDWNKEID
ncbi:hypothetical protein GCM10010912_57900 [Paenibacillus albidus]|uniref:Pre-toxin TG domain-containing protein n=1 Tax=Paenibacillus albidus TaxID=2041023 RepID=A0A917D103_9BACL|nr:hypothetical protein [Paenibacillus albidus]GGG05695.1 hypothetical protein GCM10010912_57900 [Paenibacillus albidus]